VIQLHPEFLTKDGKKEFAVLPYEEFVALQDVLADATDLLDLRSAKTEAGSAPTLSLKEVKTQLDLGEKADGCDPSGDERFAR